MNELVARARLNWRRLDEQRRFTGSQFTAVLRGETGFGSGIRVVTDRYTARSWQQLPGQYSQTPSCASIRDLGNVGCILLFYSLLLLNYHIDILTYIT